MSGLGMMVSFDAKNDEVVYNLYSAKPGENSAIAIMKKLCSNGEGTDRVARGSAHLALTKFVFG